MKPTTSKQIIEHALELSEAVHLVSLNKVSGIDGRQLGRHTGNALEFAEYRDYQPGDDIRRLDWGVFARSEQLMVKQYHEEVDPHCEIVLDQSRSMLFPKEKSQTALALAVILANAAARSGFSLAVWHAGETWIREPSPDKPLFWDSIGFTSPISPGLSIASFTGNWMKRGIRILISDFLWPEPPAPFLQKICNGARRTILLQLDFPIKLPRTAGNATLSDAETGEQREILLNQESIRKYHERLLQHRKLWQQAASEQAAEILSITEADASQNNAIPYLVRHGLLSY